jgi:hypothetical protein
MKEERPEIVVILLMKEYYQNKIKVNNIKNQRFDWHKKRKIKCTCKPTEGLDFLEEDDWRIRKKIGLCHYCKIVNDYYESLQKLHKRQRAISLKVRGIVKNYN